MCDPLLLEYPVDDSVKLLGKRWAAPVLMEIMSGRDHFNALLSVIPEVSPKTLAARVADLERSGLISKVTNPDSGVRQVSYVLTPKGEAMRSLIREIVAYTIRWNSLPIVAYARQS